MAIEEIEAKRRELIDPIDSDEEALLASVDEVEQSGKDNDRGYHALVKGMLD